MALLAFVFLAFALPNQGTATGTLGGGVTNTGTISGGSAANSGSTGASTTYGRKRRFPSQYSPGLWEVRLPPESTASGFNERFLVQIPSNPAGPEVPLLVAFHRYGNSMYDIPVNTDLMVEAEARGWYVVAPMGLSDDNLNSVPSQQNIEAVLRLMTRLYPIDSDRIYGIGHSMGGGNALSYGARHLDPKQPMFAALVNHTGVMSQQHSYANDNALRPIWDFWYGGNPVGNEFNYCRSSLIDLQYNASDLLSVPVPNQTTDMARNLTHIPIQTWIANGDPLQELIVQNRAFDEQMTRRGGDHELITIQANEHTWTILDYPAVLDFLASKTLTLPTSAKTLADRNGNYFHFGITQGTQGAFTPFTWNVDSAANSLSITQTANLSVIDIDVESAGLNARPSNVIAMTVGTTDGYPDLYRLNGLPSAPTAVTRDGQPVTNWTFDTSLSSLEIQETDGLSHQWTFTF